MTGKFQFRHARSTGGFSLVTVLLVATLAGLWLTATTMSVIPVYQKVGQTRYREVARLAAEYGIEQEISNLNGLLGATKNPFDGLFPGQTKVDNFVINAGGSAPQSYATVTITNASPPSSPPSLLYDPLTNPKNLRSQIAKLYGTMNVNDWRTLVSVGTCGVVTYKITVILKPIYNYANAPKTTSPIPSPTFLSGEYGVNEVSLLQNVFVNGSTPGAASLAGGQAVYLGLDAEHPNFTGTNVTVQGSVEVDGLLANGTAYGKPDSTISMIDGNLFVNGTVSNNVNGFVPLQNVLGTGSGSSPIQSETTPAATLPPVPSAPISATNYGFIAADPNSQPTITLQAGNYAISGINLPSGTSLVANGQVNLFVQDDVGVGSNAINIAKGASFNSAGSQTNLNIYYAGTKNLNFQNNNPNFANIYAPNAQVNLIPTSGSGSYTGSIVANVLRAQNENITYPQTLYPGPTPGAPQAFTAPASLGAFRLMSLTAVSYQEQG